VEAVEAPGGHAAPRGVGREAERSELSKGDHPVLPLRQRRDRCIPRGCCEFREI